MLLLLCHKSILHFQNVNSKQIIKLPTITHSSISLFAYHLLYDSSLREYVFDEAKAGSHFLAVGEGLEVFLTAENDADGIHVLSLRTFRRFIDLSDTRQAGLLGCQHCRPFFSLSLPFTLSLRKQERVRG